METLSDDYMENVRRLDEILGVGRSCDLVNRNYIIGGRRARLWVIDGYGKDETLERMSAFWLSLTEAQVKNLSQMQEFADRFISFSETSVSMDATDKPCCWWKDSRARH